jgi:hypothetical protein
VSRRKFAGRGIAAAFALAAASPAAAGGAATTGTASVPGKLAGTWHKNMTKAEWDRVGVARDVGVYTIVIKRTGGVIVYLPGSYRPGCTSCSPDFETAITTGGARLMLGNVPVCSFKGTYGWAIYGRTLTLKPIADKKCPVREAFFGGRWKR